MEKKSFFEKIFVLVFTRGGGGQLFGKFGYVPNIQKPKKNKQKYYIPLGHLNKSSASITRTSFPISLVIYSYLMNHEQKVTAHSNINK